MIILRTTSEVKVKVTVTRKWYATLPHPKMYPHTKFGIPTSKNIGDMDRTRKRDGRTDGGTDSAITICLPKFLWGHKNQISLTGGHPAIWVINKCLLILFLLASHNITPVYE